MLQQFFFACWMEANPGSADFDKDDEALTVNDDDLGAKLVLLCCSSRSMWKFARLDVRRKE